MSERHTCRTATTWTDNLGEGTSSYTVYLYSFTVSIKGKPGLYGSAGPTFRGGANHWNPEEMLSVAVSVCHELWYLYLCADAGICVTTCTDHAEAVMDESGNGNTGCLVSAVLKPHVIIAVGNDRTRALELYHEAHRLYFTANSVSFPIGCRAETESGETV